MYDLARVCVERDILDHKKPVISTWDPLIAQYHFSTDTMGLLADT